MTLTGGRDSRGVLRRSITETDASVLRACVHAARTVAHARDDRRDSRSRDRNLIRQRIWTRTRSRTRAAAPATERRRPRGACRSPRGRVARAGMATRCWSSTRHKGAFMIPLAHYSVWLPLRANVVTPGVAPSRSRWRRSCLHPRPAMRRIGGDDVLAGRRAEWRDGRFEAWSFAWIRRRRRREGPFMTSKTSHRAVRRGSTRSPLGSGDRRTGLRPTSILPARCRTCAAGRCQAKKWVPRQERPRSEAKPRRSPVCAHWGSLLSRPPM